MSITTLIQQNTEITAALITTIGAFILKLYFDKKPNLVAFFNHVSSHTVKREVGDSFKVHTHTVIIRNSGNAPALNVKVGHNVLPEYSVLPDIEYRIIELPSGNKELHFPRIIPKEQVTISYLYFPPLIYNQINTTVKSDEGFATIINVFPAKVFPSWKIFLFKVICLVGITTIVYGAIRALFFFQNFM